MLLVNINAQSILNYKYLFTETYTLKEVRFVRDMQLNKLVLNVKEYNKIVKFLKSKLRYKNIDLHIELSRLFCSSNDYVIKYIDTCLMMIYKTEDFLLLDVDTLEKILLRSSLLVTSEIDVYHVAKEWIGYNLKKRGKFTKRLLQTIRLPLLGKSTLKKILKVKDSSFKKNKDFCSAVNEVLNNTDFCKNKSNNHLTTRYCGHKFLDILCFGGIVNNAVEGQVAIGNITRINNFDGFKSSEVVSSLVKNRHESKVVHIRGNYYIFCGANSKYGDAVTEVEMYSLHTKACKVVADVGDAHEILDNFWYYAVCGYTDKIYLLGGLDEVQLDYCIEFDTNKHSWRHKSSMDEVKEDPAACVFEERIIVTGGKQYEYEDFVHVNLNDVENYRAINTVEAYDPIQDAWKPLPSMNFTRCRHEMVAVRKKLFVIGGGTQMNEVYDSTSQRFTVLKQPLNVPGKGLNNVFASFSIGSKLFVYFDCSSSVFSYDVIKKEWKGEARGPMKHLTKFSAIAAPRL